jgi:hypothetical protein
MTRCAKSRAAGEGGLRVRYRIIIALLFVALAAGNPTPASSHDAGLGSGMAANAALSAGALTAGSVVASALEEPCGMCKTADEEVCEQTFQTADCHQFDYEVGGPDGRGMDFHYFLSDGNVGGLGGCGSYHPSCEPGLQLGELQHVAQQGDWARFNTALERNPAAFARLNLAAGQVVVYASCSPDDTPGVVARLALAAAVMASWQQAEGAVSESTL